jgi:hypothetical protein
MQNSTTDRAFCLDQINGTGIPVEGFVAQGVSEGGEYSDEHAWRLDSMQRPRFRCSVKRGLILSGSGCSAMMTISQFFSLTGVPGKDDRA